MARRMGKFDFKDFKKLQEQLNKIQQGNIDAFIDACAKELAARLLTEVIKETPVGDYSREIEVVAKRTSKNHKKGDVYKKKVNPSGKLGGTLRRGWTSKTHEEAAEGKGKPQAEQIKAWADSLKINRVGDILEIEITNPVEYASYVESGHRTANRKGWVRGKFMLRKSEAQIQELAPKVLEKRIKKFLGECFK